MSANQHHLLAIQPYCSEILGIFSEGIYVSDRNGITLYVNKAYEEISGSPISRLLGQPVQALKESGFFNTTLNPEVVASGKEATCVQELGNNKRVILKAFPIFDEKGEVELVVTFVRDITKMTQLYEQMREQAGLIQAYHDKISAINDNAYASKTDLSLFQSPKMLNLLSRLHRLAQTDVSILLLGETGVGKDVLARLAHKASERKDKMFLKVDCGSISENLIESELFGYVPGAFSGAMSKGKLGYFEVANGGTILLDELGELPLAMQTRFLRVLQDKEVTRVGGTTPHKIDVRIIAATNKDLEKAIAEGTFRSDLYYRLNVAVLHIPPLRERKEDIRAFATHFLKMYAAKYNNEITFSDEAIEVLEKYHWPGNIRELQNIIQSIVVAKELPIIYPEHLPAHINDTAKDLSQGIACTPLNCTFASPQNSIAYKDFLQNIEKSILENAINTLGSVNATAKFFKMDRSTIFRKLNKR